MKSSCARQLARHACRSLKATDASLALCESAVCRCSHLIVELLGTEEELHVAVVARDFLGVHLKASFTWKDSVFLFVCLRYLFILLTAFSVATIV